MEIPNIEGRYEEKRNQNHFQSGHFFQQYPDLFLNKHLHSPSLIYKHPLNTSESGAGNRFIKPGLLKLPDNLNVFNISLPFPVL